MKSMKTIQPLILFAVSCKKSEGFAGGPIHHSGVRRMLGASSVRLDMELGYTTTTTHPKGLEFDAANLDEKLLENLRLDEINASLELDIDVESAESSNGMPWKQSIAGPDAPLLYMPFWEWQLDFMKKNLSNLRVLKCSAEGSASFGSSTEDLSYVSNEKKKARLVNLCFASDEYRKIRMTYYDAGENCQVFNSVFYPHEDQNIPILGIDILSFNRKKYLAIVDFQPLHDNEEDHDILYEKAILKPIREQYKSLNGKMSSKFYDETQFFSKQMLFSRFEKEKVITEELFPAYQEYVSAHLKMLQNSPRDKDSIPFVRERQTEYDTYSAERDPATGLFAAMFGKEWADQFVHGFLFSRSVMKEESGTPSPMGGSPRSVARE